MLKYCFLSWRFNQFAKHSEWFQQYYEKGLALAQKSDRPSLYKAYFNNSQKFSEFKENMAYDMFRFLNQTQCTWSRLKSWIPGTPEFKVRKKIAESLSNAKSIFKKVFIQYLYLESSYSNRNKKMPESSLSRCVNTKSAPRRRRRIPFNEKSNAVSEKKDNHSYNDSYISPRFGFWN